MDVLELPVEKLPKIGNSSARKLAKLHISTVGDLLYHIPSRYEDYSKITSIAGLVVGQAVTVEGIILSVKNFRTRRSRFITTATISDGTSILAVYFFNQPYLSSTLVEGETYYFSGRAQSFNNKLALVSPDFEKKSDKTLHTARLVPIYPETAGLTSKFLRRQISSILDTFSGQIKETLPAKILKKYKFPLLEDSFKMIHFPRKDSDAQTARKRLEYDEIFTLCLATNLKKSQWRRERKSFPLTIDQERLAQFINTLPFRLTDAQARSVAELLADLEKEVSANRLLEGDVGSGKTVVAAVGIYAAYLNGLSSVFMAPTEILVQQHVGTLQSLLGGHGIEVGVWTAKEKKWSKTVTVGTHALISDLGLKNIKNQKNGLVVIDEQQRFGVVQRGVLSTEVFSTSSTFPHILTMTATPIPRTVALTVYGDLDLSVIDEMPPGRRPVKTFVVPEEKRDSAYKFIAQKLRGRQQGFIVCPFIEPSETLTTVKAAKEEFARLSGIFNKFRLGLLHGKMKSKEKRSILESFRSGKIDLLVSTPIVEVGIDIPGATLMTVEGSERFGLSQLHQLRGRVGRGALESFCLLFTSSSSPEVLTRLKMLEKTQIGSLVAQADLELRGPGEVFGQEQHGFISLKVANLSDLDLIKSAKKDADDFLQSKNPADEFAILQKKISKFTRVQIALN